MSYPKKDWWGLWQWWANPNPDLDLNPDLTDFPNPTGFGFGFDSKIFKSVDLDLDLSFDLIIFKTVGFGFELFGKGGFGFEGLTGFGFEVAWICPPLANGHDNDKDLKVCFLVSCIVLALQ